MRAGVAATVRRSFPFPKGGFARNVAVLAGGTVGGQGLVILSTPVLTRLYSPTELGVLAVYMSLLTMALAFASARYEMAIPLPREDLGAANLAVLCFAVLVAICVVLLAPTLLFAGEIASRLNAVELQPYLWLLPAGLLGGGAYQILNYWAVRQRAFPVIARTKLSQSIAQVTAQLGLGFLGAGPLGLLVGDVAGRAGGSGALASLLIVRDRALLKRVTVKGVRAAAKRYRQFPIVSSGSSLLNTAGLQLPSLLLAVFYGPAVAGLFALSQRAVGIPMRLVGHSVGQVYLGEASRMVREEPDRLAGLFGRATRRLLLFGAPPVVAAALVGPSMFTRLFGPEWTASGTFVQLLVPMFIAQFVVSPLSQTAILLERQGLQMAADLARTMIVVGSLWLPYRLGWPSNWAVGLYSVCMVVMYIGYYQMYRRILRVGPQER